MPIRKHKKYRKPRKMFDAVRIKAENELIKRYGLKSKREIWKADAAVSKIRKQAKLLITGSEEEKIKFIEKLKKLGFRVKNIADILGLDKEDYLKRRLQSVIFERKLAKTAKEARQLIVHKHVAIGKGIVNIPSYLVPVEEESKIKVLIKKESEKRKKENIIMEEKENA